MNLLKILFQRSPRNAAVPNVQPGSSGFFSAPNAGSLGRLIDQDIKIRSTASLLNGQRHVESRYEGPNGELISCIEDSAGVVLGCGHTNENGGRGIAGLCIFCVREFQELVKKGEVDPLQAERLSMVCTDCARMTAAGHLSCPRHCKPVLGPDGATQYIDADAAKDLARQATVTKAFNAVLWLFGQPQEQPKDKIDQE